MYISKNINIFCIFSPCQKDSKQRRTDANDIFTTCLFSVYTHAGVT